MDAAGVDQVGEEVAVGVEYLYLEFILTVAIFAVFDVEHGWQYIYVVVY